MILRNGLVFQLKLGLDALRDLVLSPIALIAMLIDLSRANQVKEGYFYKLMHWGRFSDEWINLFSHRDPGDIENNSIDSILQQLEMQVTQQKLSESSKVKLSKYLEILSSTTKTAENIEDNSPHKK